MYLRLPADQCSQFSGRPEHEMGSQGWHVYYEKASLPQRWPRVLCPQQPAEMQRALCPVSSGCVQVVCDGFPVVCFPLVRLSSYLPHVPDKELDTLVSMKPSLPGISFYTKCFFSWTVSTHILQKYSLLFSPGTLKGLASALRPPFQQCIS